MSTPIDLHQHPFLRVANTATPMLSPALLSGRTDPGWKPDAPHTRTRELDAVAFGQQITQMLVIASCIGRASQVDHLVSYLLTNRSYWPPASIPVG
jgi:hypothetical protein